MKYSVDEILKDINEGTSLFIEAKNDDEKKLLSDQLDYLYRLYNKTKNG